jgi:hypothetical protein
MYFDNQYFDHRFDSDTSSINIHKNIFRSRKKNDLLDQDFG